VVAGAAIGLLLAAPLLVAFQDYRANADLFAHAGGVFGTITIPHAGLAQLVLPYVYGPLYGFDDSTGVIGTIWNQTGGYLSVSLLFFGLLGLVSPGRRGLRLVLLGWIVLVVARIYGEPPVLGHVLGVLPQMSNVAFFRYATPALELPVIVLAAVGLDGLVAKKIAGRRVLAVTVCALLVVGAAAIEASRVVHDFPGSAQRVYFWASVLWAVALIEACVVAALLRSSRARHVLATAILCVDALALFVIPQLSAPRSIAVDTSPVAFLQRHLGLSRYFTLGPLGPNFGSYYQIRQLNLTDNPVASVFGTYVVTRLDPAANPGFFNGTPVPTGEQPEQALKADLAGYRAAGVRYVLTPYYLSLPRRPKTFSLVSTSPTTFIYRLAGSAPFFTATNSSCVVTPRGDASVRLSCSGPTTLIRRETYMPGWSAAVDGHATPIRQYDTDFQAVTVPRGTHLVTFGYAPPHIGWAIAAFLIGCASLLLAPWWARGRGNRRVREPAAGSAVTETELTRT
jgi:hypothetical protein